ncbi:MAG: GAF domain-containing protein [Thainema sp.]
MYNDVEFPSLSVEVILEQIATMTLQMQQCRDLEDIVQTAIADAKNLLQTDRVFLYRCFPEQDAGVVFESVGIGDSSLLGRHLTDICADVTWIEPFFQAQVTSNGTATPLMAAIANHPVSDGAIGAVQWVEALQVSAYLVLPILSQGQPWGLLMVHHCRASRTWQPLDIQYLQQMAGHLGLAIQQANWQRTETELQETEHRLSEALKAAKAGMWYWDMSTNQTIWSEDNYRLLGYDPQMDDTSYDSWQRFIHPDDLSQVVQFFQTVVQTGQSDEMEARFVAKNGDVLWMNLFARPERDPSGKTVMAINGAAKNITDRKRREEFIQNLAAGVAATTGDAFFYSLVECLVRLLKMDHAFVSEVIEPDCDRVRVIAGISHGQRVDGLEYDLPGSPCEQVVQQGFCLFCDKVQQCFPDDHYLDEHGIEGYVGISLVDSAGSVLGLICVHHDQPITDVQFIEEVLTIFSVRAASELERQRSEALLRRYERIVSATPDAIALVDRNYTYQVVNQAYLNWYQRSQADIIGHSLTELIGYNRFEPFCRSMCDRALAGDMTQGFEDWRDYDDGQRRFVRCSLVPYIELDGHISGVVINLHDLTALKLAELENRSFELALREQQQFTEQIAESTLAILYVYDLVEQRNIYCNPQIETVLGYSVAEIQGMGQAFLPNLLHPDDRTEVLANRQQLLHLNDEEYIEVEYRLRHKDGSYRWLLSRDRIFKRAPDGTPCQYSGVAVDITLLKETQTALCQQIERERLLSDIAQHIRQTLDLDQILNTTVTEIRNCLQTDRVLIYRFNPDWSGVVIAESVAAGWSSVLGMQITDTYFVKMAGQSYGQGFIKATSNVQTADLDPCHLELLERMQVKAKLVVPILQNNHLWGLLVTQHCRAPRNWQDWEIDLQQQLATQIAIAIQQSELYQQVQSLNTGLEIQVQQRTNELQQALDFEALLRRITERVRDSLNERLILQAAVEELVHKLALAGCDAGMYNVDHTTSTIAHESITTLAPAQGQTFEITNAPYAAVYDGLLSGQVCQFCDAVPNFLRQNQQHLTMLAVPICDDQETLGDLWLFRPSQEVFTEPEIRLVQQVASQCAIALRQSRLYQAAQAQVKELERLNQLKDDFLSTVSHELRTPMSNIKMATQMLEISLNHLGVLPSESSSINRYVKVLHEEEEREINLINDLLDLARLDAGVEALSLTTIDLQFYIPHLAEVFSERIQRQQQHLVFQIPADLPAITTDLPYLERILSELLNNACKYTPAGGIITISAQAMTDGLELRVSNSGTEIAPVERDRIFDKFYRIPNNDPWRHGGTGLGLALVKKLTERLGGAIHVESGDGQTTFVLRLTLNNRPTSSPMVANLAPDLRSLL